jgi:hypothetical protein
MKTAIFRQQKNDHLRMLWNLAHLLGYITNIKKLKNPKFSVTSGIQATVWGDLEVIHVLRMGVTFLFLKISTWSNAIEQQK